MNVEGSAGPAGTAASVRPEGPGDWAVSTGRPGSAGSRGPRLRGAGVALLAALAVVGGYLADGEVLVWGVALVETLLLMIYVAWRFQVRRHQHATPVAWNSAIGVGVGGRPGAGRDTAHCERCRRAKEAREALLAGRRIGSGGYGVGHQRDSDVLHDEGAQRERMENFVKPEPTR